MTVVADERRALVERLIGRELRDAERSIDVLKLDEAMNTAKDDLEAAIQQELARVVRVWRRGTVVMMPRPEVTTRMRGILARLEQLGREEALLELHRAGYPEARLGQRTFAAPDPTPGEGVIGLLRTIQLGLAAMHVRIQDELVSTDLGLMSETMIARAVMNVPGGRDIASRVVSTAIYSGMGATFEENADLLDDIGDGRGGGWEYTAIMDGGTCDRCRPLDGKRYATWAEVQQDLPNGGPNPSCRGGGRCRCRAVPRPRGDGSAAEALDPLPVSEVFWAPTPRPGPAARITEALRAIAAVHKLPARPRQPILLEPRLDEIDAHGLYSLMTKEVMVDPYAPAITFTALHEIGHAIDDMFIGKPGEMTSWSTDPVLDEWRAAVASSLRVRQYMIGRANAIAVGNDDLDGHLEYLLMPPELFARSYSQWVAIRSGNAEALRGLAADGADGIPRQWDDDDFMPIAAALDNLVRELGLEP